MLQHVRSSIQATISEPISLYRWLYHHAHHCSYFANRAFRRNTGANVTACVYYPQEPVSPILVTFTAGDPTEICMSHSGHDNSVTVSIAGLSCASVGYVESKSFRSNGEPCGQAVWTLSYHADTKSGSVESFWDAPLLASESIELIAPPPGAQVCETEALCYQTEQKWHGVGQLWVRFYLLCQSSYSMNNLFADHI